ncbi:MAG: Exo-glucosaminidase LytG precursor [Bacteroidetes bacterium ADurb.Bin217]|nr:MAG: Exo-glucosaminidase LytG precursor [Bacteroidetes bacterium ADurb.Bin217]
MKKILVFAVLLSISILGVAQKKMTRGEYIEAYAVLAVKEMQRTGIPASITLAQACLESGNGNSALTLEANNHFGIKCHSTWSGKKIYFDDDAKNECFRVYPQALDSYIDHSEFLKNGQRYSFLFSIPASDYKAWAHGLQKAGYATNQEYAQMLIRIIEDNELYKYDNSESYAIALKTQEKISSDNTNIIVKGAAPEPIVAPPVPTENKSIKTKFGREVYKNNGVEFIIMKENETMFLISQKFSIPVWKLYVYNDLKPGQTIEVGGIIYIQPKKLRAEKPFISHKVQKGETLHSISQLYGVTLQRLAKMNKVDIDNTIEEGTNIFIRKQVIQFE